MTGKTRYKFVIVMFTGVFVSFGGVPMEFIEGNVIMAEEKTFSAENSQNDAVLLIDDFTNEDKTSALGTNWQSFTDRVMGGVSSAQHTYVDVALNGDGSSQKALNLKGVVSLENNGGFAQVALQLNTNQSNIDASGYTGVRIHVKGNDEKYYIHLRTNQTRLPWQYYSAEFIAESNWKTIDIPFSSFSPESIGTPLNLKSVSRIALVAAKAAYQADVTLSRIEFYS